MFGRRRCEIGGAGTGNRRGKMKVRAAVRRLCEYCKVVKRRNRVFVLCTVNPKHKQRQGFCDAAYDAELPPLPLDFIRRIPKSSDAKLSGTVVSRFKPAESNAGVGLASLVPSATKTTSS
ncbi:uncharacterized protein [Physcomitrium patens]|uniref:Ribosomal protein n=1 Tax=Physcomitrium patens TaxID=3218 RepID=A0A7I4F608_PHYPA|nr:uncharacterized protein LOC112292732 isoform X2 [Physcomitrium patens]|eukprot:XP_024397286.1 uncharacterized protein LOC112292732 isoform X2 [Physcomitrella patens]